MKNLIIQYFRNISRELSVHCTLRSLAKQRVFMISDPDNIWVVENAEKLKRPQLMTCLMRGWIEPLHHSVRHMRSDEEGIEVKNTYRVTGSGWNEIHHTHLRTLLGLILTALGILVGILIN